MVPYVTCDKIVVEVLVFEPEAIYCEDQDVLVK